MLKEKTYYNIQCDSCGIELDETYWDAPEGLEQIMSESGWKTLCGRHYCPDCWTYDDDDNIECKDGRIYDEDGNRVDKKIFIEDLGEDTMMQVKSILAVEKMKKWFDGLSNEEKAKFAEEYPEFVTIEKED